MSFNFVADYIVLHKAYPALATWSARPYTSSWREFVKHWPYTVPCELHEHCEFNKYPYKLYSIDEDFPDKSYYTIGLGFFDFTIDYFSLMSDKVKQHLHSGRLIALFYYHEGDNPHNIKKRLDTICEQNLLPTNCYRFVSGNTEADKIPGFVFFPDHELLYQRRSHATKVLDIHNQPRDKDFTVLSRTHKVWRAHIMADLHRQGLLSNSYWSYSTDITIKEDNQANPLQIVPYHKGLDTYTEEFLKGAPYTCDELDSDQHNDHSSLVSEHYTNSYCNIVLETHFDVDYSNGAFLTEKTFKPIKHGQPFVIIGGEGSLQTLRELGYRVFDHVIDNKYDTKKEIWYRWLKLLETIKKIQVIDKQKFIDDCWDDLYHNQQLFHKRKWQRLNSLKEKLL